MLVIGRLELQRVDFVDDVTQIVARLNFVFDFGEDFADLILKGTGISGGIFELGQVGKSFSLTNFTRSSPVIALILSGSPVDVLGAAQEDQRWKPVTMR